MHLSLILSLDLQGYLWFGPILKFDLKIVQLGQGQKIWLCTSSQVHLSRFKVSSLGLKGCGIYGPSKIWMMKKKDDNNNMSHLERET